jgi:hypothetical protein
MDLIALFKSGIDWTIAQVVLNLISLPFLVIGYVAYLVLTSEQRKKKPGADDE